MVATLVDQHLRPLGLLKLADGSEPPLKRSNPLLALKLKYAVTDPRTTRRLTDPFRFLFRPRSVGRGLSASWRSPGGCSSSRASAPAAYDAFQRPHLLLLVFVVTVLSGGFHEFGHAAAARYSGAEPGVMGAGLYLVWPAFYTDVTDSYRLGRRGRIRTDLGRPVLQRHRRGAHLRLVVRHAVGRAAAPGRDPGPADGAAADAACCASTATTCWPTWPACPTSTTGSGPPCSDCCRTAGSTPSNRVLKPWARAVITAWVLVTDPDDGVHAAGAGVGRAAAARYRLGRCAAERRRGAWRAGSTADCLDVAAHGAPGAGGGAARAGGCPDHRAASGCGGSAGSHAGAAASMPKRAIAAAMLSAVVVTASPGPGGRNPARTGRSSPTRRGCSPPLLPSAAARRPARPPRGAATRRSATVGASAAAQTGRRSSAAGDLPEGQAAPDQGPPRSWRWCSSQRQDAHDGTRQSADGPTGTAEPWVFPFDKPLPPGEGDNQAAAFNTTDGSVTYDVAFALVWADGRRGAQRQRGARLRLLLELRDGRGRVPGRADHGRRPRRGPAEPRRRRELPVLPLHHRRDRQPARALRGGRRRGRSSCSRSATSGAG